VNTKNGSGYVIPCRSQHIYCFFCLRNSMNEFIRSHSTPVCHSNFCDYQLSRHDLCCIPLERSSFRRLVSLVKSERRPKCPRCQYYIDLKNISDLDEHIESCNLENLIPCEHCFCPQEISEYEEHLQQCQYDEKGQQQKLINFIECRTEYPFSERQIQSFIEINRRNNLSLDPLSIVEALAEFGKLLVFFSIDFNSYSNIDFCRRCLSLRNSFR
jgi:hypothetical protein